MKVSTDAVLLGAKAGSGKPKRILDIGAGTGVISLMLAQRFPKALITAVEIDKDAFQQCQENFEASPFADRLDIYQSPIQEFRSDEKFDLIVSNPPYYNDHLKSSDSKRNKALHTEDLSYRELLESCRNLLAEEGEFWLILPPRQMRELAIMARGFGFNSSYSMQIFHRPGKEQHREIQTFSMGFKSDFIEKFYLKDENEVYSPAYKKLLTEFLLEF